MNIEDKWGKYRGTQAPCGYDYHPGDEHIFRDAWNLALEEAAKAMRPMLRDMISRGQARDAILALRGEPIELLK